jgi:hypothetical protein
VGTGLISLALIPVPVEEQPAARTTVVPRATTSNAARLVCRGPRTPWRCADVRASALKAATQCNLTRYCNGTRVYSCKGTTVSQLRVRRLAQRPRWPSCVGSIGFRFMHLSGGVDTVPLTRKTWCRAFFASADHKALAEIDPRKEKFRSFLLASIKNYLSKEADRARCLKRGGNVLASEGRLDP